MAIVEENYPQARLCFFAEHKSNDESGILYETVKNTVVHYWLTKTKLTVIWP